MTALLLAVAAVGLATEAPTPVPGRVLDPIVLGARRPDACESGGGDGSSGWNYAWALRGRSMTYPVRVAERTTADGSEVNGRLAWFHARPSLGLVIHEYVPNGPIGFCAGGIVVAGGAQQVISGPKAGDWVAGNGYGGETRSGAQLSFDWGPDAWQAEIMGWVAPWYGYRFGFGAVHVLPQTDDHEKIVAGSPRARFLEQNGVTAITTNMLRAEINNVLRFAIPWSGGWAEALLDLPMLDLILGGATAIGLLPADPTWKWLYLFGRPRLGVGVTQALGPVFLHAEVSVPTELLFVPWYFADAQAAVELGLVY